MEYLAFDVLREVCGPLRVRLPPERKVSFAGSQLVSVIARAGSWIVLLLLVVFPRFDLPDKPAFVALCFTLAAYVGLIWVSARLRGAALRTAKRRVST